MIFYSYFVLYSVCVGDITYNTFFISCIFLFNKKYPTIIGYKNMTSKLKHFISSSQGKNGFGWHYDDGLEQHTSEWSKEILNVFFLCIWIEVKKLYSYHVVFHVIVNNPLPPFSMDIHAFLEFHSTFIRIYFESNWFTNPESILKQV